MSTIQCSAWPDTDRESITTQCIQPVDHSGCHVSHDSTGCLTGWHYVRPGTDPNHNNHKENTMSTQPIDIPCPACHVPEGVKCVTVTGRKPISYIHANRAYRARRMDQRSAHTPPKPTTEERLQSLEVQVASLTLQIRALLQAQLQMAETAEHTVSAVTDLSTSFREHMRSEAVQMVLDDLDSTIGAES